MQADLPTTRRRLERAGQEHVLRFFDTLSEPQRRALLAQIAALDFESLPELVRRHVHDRAAPRARGAVTPPRCYPRRPERAEHHRGAGEELLRRGEVAVFMAAGGQGTRLGFDGPKGSLPAGVVSGRSLFHLFALQLLALGRRYGRPVPWYVMTSPLNHAQTLEHFERHAFFGLNQRDVVFVTQGEMPSLDLNTGKVLMASAWEIATNPDGHGGAVRALAAAGALKDMSDRGITQISYAQVDNPHVRLADPLFLGLHATAEDSSGEMSSKMVPKVSPEEKMGVFALIDGRMGVIEYSDMPAELATQRRPDGSLAFGAGSIAAHVLSVEFLRRVAADVDAILPFHRAEKKVPCVDLETGRSIEPSAPNAVKLERFLFDALAACKASIVYETDRLEEFAPIKNASGADSIESCHVLQTARGTTWLESVGVPVPRRGNGSLDCAIEISPLAALEAKDLRELPGLGALAIKPGDRLLVEPRTSA